jgi:flavin reductase (DIM6/NTAB) family NADH-FMN oxidoreductase RutF
MAKVERDPATELYPVPAVVISCADPDGKANLVTLAWVGTVCSEPPMLSIAVRPGRYSHPIIKETREFVVNIPRANQVRAVDICGSISGRSQDKFAAAKLTPAPAKYVKAPLVKEFPVNLECRVREVLSLGTHDLFIAEILCVHADEDVLDEGGDLAPEKLSPLAFVNGAYYSLGELVGSYGFSRKA